MTLANLPQVRELPLREKLELVDELWISMGSDLDSLEISEEEKDLLDTRWDKFLADPASVLTPEQFLHQMTTRRA
jgi:putative addiction module component (TIGR02574 family)